MGFLRKIRILILGVFCCHGCDATLGVYMYKDWEKEGLHDMQTEAKFEVRKQW